MAAKDAEEVRVVRPLKVIALICSVIAVAMIVVSLVTSFWLEGRKEGKNEEEEGDRFHQGLWQYCVTKKEEKTCVGTASNKEWIWITACGGLCSIATIATILAAFLILCRLLVKAQPRKHACNVAAIVALLTAIISLLAALILFPVVFIQKIEKYRVDYEIVHWYFSWSYGITWGTWIFLVGSVVLLLIDRDSDKIQHKEKKYYDSNL